MGGPLPLLGGPIRGALGLNPGRLGNPALQLLVSLLVR